MNPFTTYGWFFRGPVRFVSQGFITARYSLTVDGTIIKVKNSVHIRLIPGQAVPFPDIFEIIAPVEAVTVINGSVPDSYMHHLAASEYLNLRRVYQGF